MLHKPPWKAGMSAPLSRETPAFQPLDWLSTSSLSQLRFFSVWRSCLVTRWLKASAISSAGGDGRSAAEMTPWRQHRPPHRSQLGSGVTGRGWRTETTDRPTPCSSLPVGPTSGRQTTALTAQHLLQSLKRRQTVTEITARVFVPCLQAVGPN